MGIGTCIHPTLSITAYILRFVLIKSSTYCSTTFFHFAFVVPIPRSQVVKPGVSFPFFLPLGHCRIYSTSHLPDCFLVLNSSIVNQICSTNTHSLYSFLHSLFPVLPVLQGPTKPSHSLSHRSILNSIPYFLQRSQRNHIIITYSKDHHHHS